jgi:hypothetical protein
MADDNTTPSSTLENENIILNNNTNSSSELPDPNIVDPNINRPFNPNAQIDTNGAVVNDSKPENNTNDSFKETLNNNLPETETVSGSTPASTLDKAEELVSELNVNTENNKLETDADGQKENPAEIKDTTLIEGNVDNTNVEETPSKTDPIYQTPPGYYKSPSSNFSKIILIFLVAGGIMFIIGALGYYFLIFKPVIPNPLADKLGKKEIPQNTNNSNNKIPVEEIINEEIKKETPDNDKFINNLEKIGNSVNKDEIESNLESLDFTGIEITEDL